MQFNFKTLEPDPDSHWSQCRAATLVAIIYKRWIGTYITTELVTFHFNSGSIIFSLSSADTLHASCGSTNQEEFHTLADESEETFHTLRDEAQDEFHTLKGIEELEEDHQFSGRGLLSIPTEASQ